MNKKEKASCLRQNKGITLIALVVTIIVLIILAGISINLILGENGIIKKATEAKNETQIAKEKEQIQLAAAAASIIIETDKDANAEEVFLAELEEYFGEGEVTVEGLGETSYKVTVVDSEREYEVDLTSGIASQTGSNIKVVYPTQEDYADVEETDASYFVFDSSTGAITSLANIDTYYTSGTKYPSIIKVPEKIDGVTVTSVALSLKTEITEVTDIVLPDTVTVIEETAFQNMTNLKRIVMPSKLVEISDKAFKNCTSLEAVKIADTVTSIGYESFFNTTSLKEIVIVSNTITIGDYAFRKSGIVNASITGNNVEFEYAPFYNCNNLINVKLGSYSGNTGRFLGMIRDCKNIKNIEVEECKGMAVRNCDSLESIKISNLNGKLLIINCNSLTNLQIDESTNESCIKLEFCVGLEELTIPDTMQNYGSSSQGGIILDDLYGLKKLTIPANLTGLSAGELYANCPLLNEIEVVQGGNYVYEDGILYNKDKTEVIWVAYTKSDATETITATGELTVDTVNSYYTVGDHIRTIKIAEGVTKIGDSAFAGTTEAYCEIILPSTLKEIGEHAFSGSKITKIVIPDGVTTIGESAFAYCSALKEIIIPDSVTSIGDYAFEGCKNLSNITIPEGVTSIGSNMFYNCKSLTNIIIPDGVTSVESSAFEKCDSLTNITIPKGVTSIGNSAFEYCTGLTTITIPESVTSIGSYAFYGCSSLTNIEIPASVTSIGNYAFRDCTGLTINCETSSQPSGWSTTWNYLDYAGTTLVPVKWGQ